LEEVVSAQAEFLLSRDPSRRKALTQRALSQRLDVSPSVLNRLIANKSVQLPWGLEAPLKVFVPSAKAILRDHLYQMAVESPELSDEALRRELKRRYGAELSRRSIAQYRKELGLGGTGGRVSRPSARA
jgi:DNA-directed RNA polymerase specialized sigma54-like protein